MTAQRRHNPPTPIATARRFCRYHLGRDCFAPFTGQDFSAWSAFVYACELWGRADYDGREACARAMRALVDAAQESTHQVFINTIPAILDWPHVDNIWPRAKPGSALRPIEHGVLP